MSTTIESFNLSYLHLVREIAHKGGVEEAMLRFGLARTTVESVIQASVSELHALAHPELLIFRPLLSPQHFRQAMSKGGALQTQITATLLSKGAAS